jgi:hypothetical protein
MFVFQAGMFSFWVSVAFAPRMLLHHREEVEPIRKAFRRFLISGMVVVYVLTLVMPRKARFGAGIGSILLVFLRANYYYFQYLRALGQHGRVASDTETWELGIQDSPEKIGKTFSLDGNCSAVTIQIVSVAL